MKKKRRAKKRKAVRSSRARYSKALLRAMRSRKRRKFSVSRRRIAANPKSAYSVAASRGFPYIDTDGGREIGGVWFSRFLKSAKPRYVGEKESAAILVGFKKGKTIVKKDDVRSNPNRTVRQVVADLQAARKGLKAKGWDVSDVSIGSHGEMIKVADSRGAYNILTHPRLRYHSVGHPTKASEWIVVEVVGSV